MVTELLRRELIVDNRLIIGLARSMEETMNRLHCSEQAQFRSLEETKNSHQILVNQCTQLVNELTSKFNQQHQEK